MTASDLIVGHLPAHESTQSAYRAGEHFPTMARSLRPGRRPSLGKPEKGTCLSATAD
ncbi:MAG: hypothetical protein IPM76_24380 [Chloroflexi bacterium]|nr:hypothetical protein [Chloroflexota bacterium]